MNSTLVQGGFIRSPYNRIRDDGKPPEILQESLVKLKNRLMTGLLFLGLIGSATAFAADSLEDAARDAVRETGGKVLSARTLDLRDGRTHEVKVLTREGRVRTLRIPDESSHGQQSRGDREYPHDYDRRVRPRDLPRNLERNREEDRNRYQDPRARQSYRQLFRDQNVQRAPDPDDRRRQERSRSNRGNPDAGAPDDLGGIQRGSIRDSRSEPDNRESPERWR